MLAVAIAKLWVVAGAEVLAQRHDAAGYAQSTVDLVWGTKWLPTHPAGLPMIATLVAQFGVPWRLALELFYLAACCGLAASVERLIASRVAAVALFAAMVWHPWTLSGFGDFMSDPLVLVLGVGLLAMMFRILGQVGNCWSWQRFVGMGVLLFFWESIRSEEPLVYATYALFAVLAWALTRGEVNPMPRRWSLMLLALPVVMVLGLSTGVKLINYYHFGVYAKSRTSQPALMTLMATLYKIKPDRELRYAPVTRQSLQAACQASPTLGQFQKALLDPQRAEVRDGEAFTRSPGEFGSWLHFLLMNSLPWDQREADRIMRTAAVEINDALRDGRLPGRLAFFPLDPAWRLWLPHLLPSFLKSLRLGCSMVRWRTWEPPARPELESRFDEAATRRAVNAYPSLLLVDGTVRVTAGTIDSVALTEQHGKLLTASPLIADTLDRSVFHLRSALQTDAMVYGLDFFREGRLQFSSEIQDTKRWMTDAFRWRTVVLPGSGETVVYSAIFTVADATKQTRLDTWEPRAEVLCMVLTWGAVVLTLLIVLFGQVWEPSRFRRLLACLVLSGGWLVGRAALYGLIVANTGWSSGRYMNCISPLFILMLVLAAATSGALLRRLAAGRQFRNSGRALPYGPHP